MFNNVDRTQELEQRIKKITVSSEDTCCFWEKNEYTQMNVKKCFHCAFYLPEPGNECKGSCSFPLKEAPGGESGNPFPKE